MECLYSVQEIAERLKVSEDYVRKVFAPIPGVIHLPPSSKRSRRPYQVLRIPQSVLDSFLLRNAA